MSRIRGPYKADKGSGIVWAGEKHFHFADVRGWGQLVGAGGMGLPQGEAARIQDENLQFLVDALNEKEAREATPDQVQAVREECIKAVSEALYLHIQSGKVYEVEDVEPIAVAAIRALEGK